MADDCEHNYHTCAVCTDRYCTPCGTHYCNSGSDR